jgi:hypothetical protein
MASIPSNPCNSSIVLCDERQGKFTCGDLQPFTAAGGRRRFGGSNTPPVSMRQALHNLGANPQYVSSSIAGTKV